MRDIPFSNVSSELITVLQRKRNNDIMKRLGEERNDIAKIASNEICRFYDSLGYGMLCHKFFVITRFHCKVYFNL